MPARPLDKPVPPVALLILPPPHLLVGTRQPPRTRIGTPPPFTPRFIGTLVPRRRTLYFPHHLNRRVVKNDPPRPLLFPLLPQLVYLLLVPLFLNKQGTLGNRNDYNPPHILPRPYQLVVPLVQHVAPLVLPPLPFPPLRLRLHPRPKNPQVPHKNPLTPSDFYPKPHKSPTERTNFC